MKAEMARWIQSRVEHILTLDRDHARVTADALSRSAEKRWGTPGRNWCAVGLGPYDPVPQEQMAGNVRRGRILRRPPADMRDRWAYDLDGQGRVLRARLHLGEWLPAQGYEECILVPSAAEDELTYLHFSLREGMMPCQEYFFVYRFDDEGHLTRCLQGRFREGMPPAADAQTFYWEGATLLRVQEHVTPAEEPSWADMEALKRLRGLML